VDTGIQVETLRIAELGESERRLWSAFRAADPRLQSPYFDLRYIDVAGRTAPGGRMAVIHRRGAVVGFLPYQRRGATLQPLAAPMSDFHAVVADREAGIDLAEVVRGLGADRVRFTGLLAERAAPGARARHAMAADLSQGFAAYEAGRSAAFLKDKRRRMRALERDHGSVDFTLKHPTPELLDLVIARKREQIQRTHQHDIFACGWTASLLRELDAVSDPDFGLKLAVLRAGDTVIAAELGLTSGARHHLWFPIYDPAYAKYSPGALMTLETLKAATGQGITRVDFGPSEEAYKEDFADPMECVLEGAVHGRTSLVERLGVLAPGAGRLQAASARLGRRLDRIAACEPHLAGQVLGTSSLVAGLAVRHPRLGAGIGAGLGAGLSIGLGLSLLAE
jgi:CelD/BcsL family acetyltransferase involved in cellulose biosynthesis